MQRDECARTVSTHGEQPLSVLSGLWGDRSIQLRSIPKSGDEEMRRGREEQPPAPGQDGAHHRSVRPLHARPRCPPP